MFPFIKSDTCLFVYMQFSLGANSLRVVPNFSKLLIYQRFLSKICCINWYLSVLFLFLTVSNGNNILIKKAFVHGHGLLRTHVL